MSFRFTYATGYDGNNFVIHTQMQMCVCVCVCVLIFILTIYTYIMLQLRLMHSLGAALCARLHRIANCMNKYKIEKSMSSAHILQHVICSNIQYVMCNMCGKGTAIKLFPRHGGNKRKLPQATDTLSCCCCSCCCWRPIKLQ